MYKCDLKRQANPAGWSPLMLLTVKQQLSVRSKHQRCICVIIAHHSGQQVVTEKTPLRLRPQKAGSELEISVSAPRNARTLNPSHGNYALIQWNQNSVEVRMTVWWSQSESNRRPLECHSSALPTELWPHCRQCRAPFPAKFGAGWKTASSVLAASNPAFRQDQALATAFSRSPAKPVGQGGKRRPRRARSRLRRR